ncbi:MAG: RNA polymerase sigma factor [Chthoniobacterales bacterium]
MNPNAAVATQPAYAPFMTTRWSVVLSSADGEKDNDQARAALSELCRIYWQPVFAFICRWGYSVEDAQDLTQDFFVLVLEGNLLRQADPARGRFRSLLLKSLQNFLADAHEKRSTKKRGGRVKFVPWNDGMGETPSNLRVPAHMMNTWTPERLFDIRWAATMVERALRRLRQECEARGRRRVFDVLSGLLSAERREVSYEEFSKPLGVTGDAVKRLIYHLRRRYRAILREEVAQTVADEREVEDEIRYLCAALAAGSE